MWDILSFSQLKKEKCLRLCDQYTRLSVNLENQTLLSYGPIGTTLEGDVSVNLTGGGIDSFSYSFISGGFTTKDLSDMANNYGRWHFVDIVGNVSSFTTEPGIRATNTTGNFIVELSHAIEIFSSFMLYKDHGTGVIQIYLADR